MFAWLKSIRESKKLSQLEVSQAVGVSQQYYSLLETGKRGVKLPVNTAKRIAQALGFDWRRFYDD